MARREREETSSLVSLIRELIQSWGPYPPDLIYNCLPKSPSPNTVTLGVRAKIYELEGGGNSVYSNYCSPSLVRNMGRYFSNLVAQKYGAPSKTVAPGVSHFMILHVQCDIQFYLSVWLGHGAQLFIQTPVNVSAKVFLDVINN